MTPEIERVVEAFTDATNRHDIDAMLTLVSEDVAFESTAPPDGEHVEGKTMLREVWEEVFRNSPRSFVETEEMIVSGDRCITRLRYVFDVKNPDAGHVRAVDVLRVANGKITEKLSYVKG